jgi:hypothetical protein
MDILYGVGGYKPDHPNGNIARTYEDHGDGTASFTFYSVEGEIDRVEIVTGLPLIPAFPALDAAGSLATLLVVEGIIELQDAANAIHEEPEHLIHEAQAWSL